MEPEYSTVPLTDLTERRSQLTSLNTTSPLTDDRSRPRAFSPFAVMLPLTLPAERSPSDAAPVSDTSPETLFACSSFGVSVVVTLPLTDSARTVPRTPETFSAPDTECTSRADDGGTVTVKSTETPSPRRLRGEKLPSCSARISTRPARSSTTT